MIADISETLLPPSQATWEQVYTPFLPRLPFYPYSDSPSSISPRSQLSHLAHLNSSFLHLSAVFYSQFFHFGSTISFSPSFPPFSSCPSLSPSFPPFSFPFFPAPLLPPVPRPGASALHSSPESGSTPAVHGAFGQTHVQRLRRLVCHSPTSSKGW